MVLVTRGNVCNSLVKLSVGRMYEAGPVLGMVLHAQEMSVWEGKGLTPLGVSAVDRADRHHREAESCWERDEGHGRMERMGAGSTDGPEWKDAFQRLLGRQRWMKLKTTYWVGLYPGHSASGYLEWGSDSQGWAPAQAGSGQGAGGRDTETWPGLEGIHHEKAKSIQGPRAQPRVCGSPPWEGQDSWLCVEGACWYAG